MKTTQWLVLASSVQSLIYEVEKQEFKLIKTLEHDQSRLREIELVSDKQGTYISGKNGKYSRQLDAHEKEHHLFAQEIAQYLDKARKDNQYQGLIICAEPHFYGLIESAIPKTVQSLIQKAVQKNYISLPEAERNQVIESILLDARKVL